MAEIARQGDDPYAGVRCLQGAQVYERAVTTAIVDEQQLEIDPRYGLERLHQSPVSFANDLRFVEARHHDGYQTFGRLRGRHLAMLDELYARAARALMHH